MARLGVGLIGCGPMGRSLAKSLQSVPEAALVAVSDPVEEARQQAAQEQRVPAHADYQELLARADVGAVIVATPTYLHPEISIAAAAAGKHVFCEKPMALSLTDCDAMIAAAQRAKVKLMVGQVLRLLFPFARVAELAREAELGAPVAVDISRYGPWRPRAGWRRYRSQSGGPLYELNVHELDFLRHLCGEVAEVSAHGGNFLHPEYDFPDLYFVTLCLKSGAVARLRGGGAGQVSKYDGEAICPRGTISWQWGEGKVYRPDAEPEPITRDQWGKPDGFVWELTSFVEWVLRDTPPVITAPDGRAAVELAQAAYLSLEERRPVALPL